MTPNMTPNTQFLNFIILIFLHFPLGNNVTSMLGIMLGFEDLKALGSNYKPASYVETMLGYRGNGQIGCKLNATPCAGKRADSTGRMS